MNDSEASDIINSSLNDHHQNNIDPWIDNNKEFNSLFAYDNIKNEFEINMEVQDLKEEHREYIKNTWDTFNMELKSSSSYVPYCLRFSHFVLYLLGVLLFGAMLYLSLLICALCLFNPMIVMVIIFFGIKFALMLWFSLHYYIWEKSRTKKMQKLIEIENEKQEQDKSMLMWKYGRDGSWIEVKIGIKK